MLTTLIARDELKYHYPTEDIDSLSELDVLARFNAHCQANSEVISAGDVISNFSDSRLLIATPDSWQELGDFYIKSPRNIVTVSLVSGDESKVSDDHLFETATGWKRADSLTTSDQVLTPTGFYRVSSVLIGDKEEVYDWEVLHENHRYWAGNMSSHNTGKSFLCMNAAREAQAKGYGIIYIDTEGALDTTDFDKFGVDRNMLKYVRLGLISEVKIFINEVVRTIEENPDTKVMIFLDSMSQLETDKEVNDLDKGKVAGDMGLRAKELRATFRSFTLDLSNLKIPFIFTSHISASMDQYKPDSMSGGKGPEYSASIVLMLTKGVLKDEATGTKTGVICRAGTFKNRLAQPDRIEMHISFLRGMNPYVGLHLLPFTWENCGVGRGNKLTEKEFSKLKPAEQIPCKEFTVNGETFYFSPRDTARNYILKHNGNAVPIKELFSGNVWTQEVLEELDKNVVGPKYKYSTIKDVLDQEEKDLAQLESTDDLPE